MNLRACFAAGVAALACGLAVVRAQDAPAPGAEPPQAGERDAKAEERFNQILAELQAGPREKDQEIPLLRTCAEKLEAFQRDFAGTLAAASSDKTLGQLLMALNEPSRALTAFERAVTAPSNAPDRDQIDVYRGYALHALGRYQEAIDLLTPLRQGERLKTEIGARATATLAEVYADMGNIPEARSLLEELEASQPDNVKMKSFVESQRAALKLKAMIGSALKPFQVKTVDGSEFSIESHKGRVILIDFWATWCGPCREELPNLKKLLSGMQGRPFVILGVSGDGKDEQEKPLGAASSGNFQEWLKEHGIAWPQYYDGKGWRNTLFQQYGIQSIPMTLLVDARGNVRRVGLRGEALQKAVEALVQEAEEAAKGK